MLGQQATRLANTPASRSKQAARATSKGSLRCFVPQAKSPNSLICCVLSIRETLFKGRNLKLTVVSTQTAHLVDRCHNLVLASTEIPVFMDKIAQLTILSTITALFMDSPRFRWREYGQQATRLANTPASRSKQAKSPHTIWFSPLPQTPA